MKRLMKRLIAVLTVCLLLVSSAWADGYAAVVTGGWLRLRDAPSYDSNTIASYFTGTKVTVLSTANGWSRVRVSDGNLGYMNSAYLSTGSGGGSSGGGSSVYAMGYVTSSNGGRVALRTGAGKGYGVIMYCNVGTQVTVLNSGTTWDRVQVGSTTGYMMAKYITFSSSAVVPPSPSSNTSAYVSSANGKAVNMRSGAGMGYPIIRSYAVGTQVTILSEGATWDYVQAGSNKGYMMKKYLSSTKPSVIPAPAPAPSTGGAYVTSSNGKAVRLRSGPGTSYAVIGLYNVNTPVTILTAGAEWSRVRIGTQEGYMMSAFLGNSTVPIVDPGTPLVYTAYIVSENGKGVYLRYGPSISNNVIALYPVGTEVKVLKTNGTWDYVSIGTRTGYMMHQFLSSTYTGNTVTAVTLSNLTPHVGDTLVPVTVPGGATVSYTWINDLGQVLSTGSSYVVQNTDLDRRIRVRVVASGTYTGSATSSFTETITAGSSVQHVTGCTINNSTPRVGDIIKASATPAGATVSYIWYRKGSVDTYIGTGSVYTVTAYDQGYSIYAVAIGYSSWTGSVASTATSAVLPKLDVALSGTVVLPAASVVGNTLTPSLSLNSYSITYHWYQNGVEVGNLNTLLLTSDMAGDDIRLVVSAVTGSGYSGSVSSNYCLVQAAVSGKKSVSHTETLSASDAVTLTASTADNSVNALQPDTGVSVLPALTGGASGYAPVQETAVMPEAVYDGSWDDTPVFAEPVLVQEPVNQPEYSGNQQAESVTALPVQSVPDNPFVELIVPTDNAEVPERVEWIPPTVLEPD